MHHLNEHKCIEEASTQLEPYFDSGATAETVRCFCSEAHIRFDLLLKPSMCKRWSILINELCLKLRV